MLITLCSGQFALPSFQAVANADNVGPRITITATDGSSAVTNGSTTNDNTLTLTFTCNETTSNFTVGDIGLVGGSISSFSGSDRVYTATFTPSSNRLTKIYIPTGAYTDGMSNNNYASEIFEWTYDSSVPLFYLTTLAADNSTVNVQLSETVFNSSSGTGALEVGDWSFALAVPLGGDPATLSSSTPSSISKGVPTFSDNTIDADLNGAISIFASDLDQDGDVDVIGCSSQGSNLVWYENNGSQSFTKYTIDASLAGAREAIAKDLDRDGDMDIIAIAGDGDKLCWYDNNGSQSFTKTTIDASIEDPRGIDVADLDGDNDVDIILDAYTEDVLVWYENNGFESFTKNTIVSDAGFRPFSVDLDEDGDIDIVTSDMSSDELLWFENDGAASFTERSIDGSIDNPRGVSVADIDEDGDLDIVTVSFDADDVVWYANNGSESFTKYTIESNIDKPYRVQIADVDLDGDLDILSHGYNDDDVAWYKNVDGGYNLGISLSGTAIGTEILTISPISNSIYDAGGNVASTSQSYNTATLNDKTGPTMTITAANSSSASVSDGSTTNDNPLTITFTSNENTTNFAVADVTVSGGSLTSFSGSGTTYLATFTPSSDGATTIDVAGSTFTDASSNNNSAASQFNWTYDGTVPTITGNSLAADNSTISVTFSEAVYNTSSGSGSLETTDFTLSSSGGNASLSSSTPSSISSSGNTYTLGISLSGTANGSETLTVNPISNSIYDAVGNVASSSQSNNSVSLNAVVSNYVLDLNGSNEAAYVGDNSNFETTDWSIQAWVDPNSLPSSGNDEWFVNKNRVYRVGLNNSGGTTKIVGAMRSGGSYETIYGTTLSNASGGWYHVVLTFDDGTNDLKLYVNGSLVAANYNYSGSTVNQSSEFSIGRRHDTNQAYFHGKIDEVAYWNTNLSASAISTLYNSGNTLSASANSGNYSSSGNLVLYYQFQENLNDSEGSFNLTGRNISSSDYTAETID